MSPSSQPRVLIVEDDPRVAAGLVRGLKKAGFETELTTDGTAGARLALGAHFDAMLLDLMLPGHSGFEVLAALQGRRSIPIIVLTARTDLEDRLRAFGLGAVDFVPKPFWIEEIVARIRARLDGAKEPAPARMVRFADAIVDLDARTLEVANAKVALTRFEFDLLAYLLERPDRAIARQQLAEQAVGALDLRSERTIDSHMTHLRKKLGPKASACIVTVWGVGYRFAPEP